MCSRIGLTGLLLLLLSSLSYPQNKDKQVISGESRPTFRIPVNLVVVNTTVTDKDGKPVFGLSQDDFKLYEDGKPQPIQTFAAESYESDHRGPAAANKTGEKRTTDSTPTQELRPRMIYIMIDDVTAGSTEYFPRAAEAVAKFIEDDLEAGDQVALAVASGRVQFQFSNDKSALLEEIKTILEKLNLQGISRTDCPKLTDLQAKTIAEDSLEAGQTIEYTVALEETLQCMSVARGNVAFARAHLRSAAFRQNQETEYATSVLLHSLRTCLRTLRHFDAAKSLILFSNGFLSEGSGRISYSLQDVVDQALSSGVVLNTIDIRGLYTPIMPASEHIASRSPISSANKLSVYMDDMSEHEAPLRRMARETGGLFFHNSNDIYSGLNKIIHRHSSYYVLTYAAPSKKSDGQFHSIKVEVSKPGVEISYRQGYYAPKEELAFERRKKEEILEGLQAPGNFNEIPIGLGFNHYQEDASTYVLALTTNVGIRGLHFIDEDSRRKNLITLVVAAFDELDHYVDGIEKSIDFKLTDASYENVLAYGINSKVEFKLPIGRYKIKALVRDGAEGKMGLATRVVEIP